MTTASKLRDDLQSPTGAPDSSPPPLITLRDVSKRYANGMQALSGIDLTVGDGEFVSLLGPSGCGKSTLLRVIAGLGSITGGSIDWSRGASETGSAPHPDLGFVFQEPTLMPWATVFNNVYLPLKLARIHRAEATPRINEALAMVGLENFAGAHPRQLSGGMKMRVSIARALVTHPRVLLLDEPFAALDEITRFRLNNDLLTLWQRLRWTVIFVTHSVFESVYLSQRIVVMSSGPGRVATDVRISAPYPRDETFRTSSVYNEFCRITSTELGLAMGNAQRS
jgi:NitT/TauT family transport system ATP-binding protein